MADYYEYSIPELIKLLGARFKDYRLRSNMTQKDVSEQSGITITTIHKFENGTSGNMSLGTFLLLMKAIGQINTLDELLDGPEWFVAVELRGRNGSLPSSGEYPLQGYC